MKLGIIGSGIAGSSAARIGRIYGFDVTVFDHAPERAASRCALATIRPQWFKEDLQGTIQESWKWYEAWGSAITQHAYVSHWRNSNVKLQKDWWLVDPEASLVTPDISEQVRFVNDNIIVTQDDQYEFDAVLNATGAYGGNLSVPHEDLWGATLISTNAVLDYKPLRIHHIRPYHTLTIAENRGEIRLGSSIAKTEADAIRGVEEMLEVAETAKLILPGASWQVVTGIRSRVKGNQPTLPKLGETTTSIGNLARSGYAIAPAVIANWLKSLL